MGNNNCRRFHSSYVIDVSSEPAQKRVRLTDTMRMSWFVDTESEESAKALKAWLGSVFLKGIPNSLTVFEYEDRGTDPDIENYVVRFVNIPKTEKKMIAG